MKRYLLFTHDQYYPSGAETAFCGDFNQLEEVENHLIQDCSDFAHVLDTVTGEWNKYFNNGKWKNEPRWGKE